MILAGTRWNHLLPISNSGIHILTFIFSARLKGEFGSKGHVSWWTQTFSDWTQCHKWNGTMLAWKATNDKSWTKICERFHLQHSLTTRKRTRFLFLHTRVSSGLHRQSQKKIAGCVPVGRRKLNVDEVQLVRCNWHATCFFSRRIAWNASDRVTSLTHLPDYMRLNTPPKPLFSRWFTHIWDPF